MNKMKTQNFLAALSLMVMVSACGKSMNLQVSGPSATDAQNQAPGTIDTTKTRLQSSSNQILENFSEYDMKELKDTLKDTLLKRAIHQVPPKDEIKEVTELKLTLNKAVIADAKNAWICIVETECRPLGDLIAKASDSANVLELDLREVFGLQKKNNEELVEWIYANSAVFGEPLFRKFRFQLEGITSIESGSLLVQVITKHELSAVGTPSCLEHGEEDRNGKDVPAAADTAKPAADITTPETTIVSPNPAQ